MSDFFEADFEGLVCACCEKEIDDDRYFKDVCDASGIEGYEILCLVCYLGSKGELI